MVTSTEYTSNNMYHSSLTLVACLGEINQVKVVLSEREKECEDLKVGLKIKEMEVEDLRAAAAVSESALKDIFDKEKKELEEEIATLKEIMKGTHRICMNLQSKSSS